MRICEGSRARRSFALSGRVFWLRQLSKYLWTAMKVVSRNPASTTRRIKGWVSGWGCRSARATVHSRLNSEASRRSRTMATSGAYLRRRTSTRRRRLLRVVISGFTSLLNLGTAFGLGSGGRTAVGRGVRIFLVSLSIPLISSRYGGLADIDARTGLEAGWERLVVGRLLDMGCLGASVAVWIWFGSDCNYGRGVLSRLARGECQ